MFVPGLCLCPVYLSLFICKTCPLVLQLQLTLPAGCIYSSFQLDSDIYVHLLRTIVRHLEGLAPFSPLTLFLFSLPFFSLLSFQTENMNADLPAAVPESLMNGCISGKRKQENTSVM